MPINVFWVISTGYSKVLDQKEAANEESSSRRLPRTITRVVVGVE